MKRYCIFGRYWKHVIADDGDYILYSDHLSDLSALKAENTALRATVDDIATIFRVQTAKYQFSDSQLLRSVITRAKEALEAIDAARGKQS